LIALVLIVLAIRWLPMMMPHGTEDSLSVNTSLSGEYINILLLGSDNYDSDQPGRTDSMLIMSVNAHSGDVILTSLMRDTVVDIPGRGRQKINAAYRYGGGRLAMQTVNLAFGMNITQYAAVDFLSFPYLIDYLGGINITVKDKEFDPLNRLVLSVEHLYRNSGLDVSLLKGAGNNVRVTGVQALAFSRIRSIDSDYMRASRQRMVIDATLSKLRSIRNPITLMRMLNVALNHFETNMNSAQLVILGLKVLLGGADIEQYRIPAEGAYESGTYGGSWEIKPDLDKNRTILYQYIYG
jgi:LCP family protein required for cell wall assembly